MVYKTNSMNTPQTTFITTPARQKAVTGLAVVGFVALIVLGLSLAVYSTRFVPGVVNRVGSAAVYLGSVFNPTPAPAITVVPNSSAATTISFGASSATPATTTTTTTTTSNVATTPVAKVPATSGQNTSNTYQIASGSTAAAPYGLPDLTVYITDIGYLTSASADSYVSATTVPSGDRPAVKFTIKNIGTNWTGTWRFSASIPTRTSYVFQSDQQQSLAPGESIDYTLGFDQALTGANQLISITANSDHTAAESTESNNNITAFFNVLP
jgi:CARDB